MEVPAQSALSLILITLTAGGCSDSSSTRPSPKLVLEASVPASPTTGHSDLHGAQYVSEYSTIAELRILPPELLEALLGYEDGDSFKVAGPLGYCGRGAIRRSGSESLTISLDMPAQRVLFRSIPRTVIRMKLDPGTEPGVIIGDVTVNGIGNQGVVFVIERRESSVVLRPAQVLESTGLRSISLSPAKESRLAVSVEVKDARHELLLQRTGRKVPD